MESFAMSATIHARESTLFLASYVHTVMSYSGYVMYVNYDFDLEYTPFGIIFHHYYSDSEIITGSTQVISFY